MQANDPAEHADDLDHWHDLESERSPELLVLVRLEAEATDKFWVK